MQKYHSFITLFARSTIYLVPLFVLLDGSWITFLGRGSAETSIQNSNMVDFVKDLAFENACTAVFLLLDSSISSGKVKNPSSHSVFYLLQLKLRIQTGDQLENQRDESTMQGFRIK